MAVAPDLHVGAGTKRSYFSAKALIEGNELGLKGTSLLSMSDFNAEQLAGVLDLADAMHSAHHAGVSFFKFSKSKGLAMIFEKASLRTKTTFDLGIQQLGGHAVMLSKSEIGLGERESVADVAGCLSRWVNCIMARVHEHDKLTGLAEHSGIPVINALSDDEHPCQILADLLTLKQHKGKLSGLKVAWVGDGNNVLHSLMIGCALSGVSVVAACPAGYWPQQTFVERAKAVAIDGATIEITTDPVAAVSGADAVYTDTWTSMGQEEEAVQRRIDFEGFQINSELMAHAKCGALFMHCLPAHRGEEATDEVLDGPNSVIFDQAENRLHAQKAVMALLMGS